MMNLRTRLISLVAGMVLVFLGGELRASDGPETSDSDQGHHTGTVDKGESTSSNPKPNKQQPEKTDIDDTKDKTKVTYHTVGPEETLGSIALNHGASVANLMKWNDLELGEAREGMRIVIDKEGAKDEKDSDKKRPVIHRVSQGETLGDIAEQYRVTVDQIEAWNPGLNPRHLQIGDRLHLKVPGRDGESVSYGKPSSGRLYNGVVLRGGPGLEVRNLPEAYGTERTIRLLKAAAADVQARWPNSPDLVVGDLSLAGGGPMPPHRSHQSGRDVDLSFYYKGNVQLPNFELMNERTFDARKNWHFFKTLIDAGKVQFIFVHMDLQEQLYEYAKSIGYTDEQLADILQYPRPASRRVGIIRHTGGHDNHSHIRFTCAPDAEHCH